jgi:hypothetical protein
VRTNLADTGAPLCFILPQAGCGNQAANVLSDKFESAAPWQDAPDCLLR